MSAKPRLTTKQKVDVIQEYDSNFTPMIELAKRYNVSRQAIHKLLNRAGVDTSDRQIAVSCSVCNLPIMRHKTRIRRQKNHFCSTDCYHAFLQAGNFKGWRQGGRIARAKVSKLFDLQGYHRVHHKDNNQHNNRLDNLCVFANQGDHVRAHRGFDVQPLWDGLSHIQEEANRL